MPSFRLGVVGFKALNGEVYEQSVSIERETEKAILLNIKKRGRELQKWIPRSLCNFRSRPDIRVIDGKPQDMGLIEELHVADWFWQKEFPEGSW